MWVYRNYLLIIYLFVLGADVGQLNAQANKFRFTKFDTPVKKSEFLLYLAKNYNSNAYSILNNKDDISYTKWTDGVTHNQILKDYASIVHETCHTVNDDIGGFWTRGFYISPSIKIKVYSSTIFKSSELDKTVPEAWKSKIFRYKTYIKGLDGDNEISSISDGIYGLMDEFVAYYQGTRAAVELYGYYQTFTTYNEPFNYMLYLSGSNSNLFAWYEFRLFIAWYLKYAKKNYPAIYQSLMQNKSLRVVFSLTDNGYKKVLDQYFTFRKKIFDNIIKTGINKAEITDHYFFIRYKTPKGSKLVGYGIPDGEIAWLKSIFTVEDYQILEAFRIQKLNEQNYAGFLK